MKSLWFVLSSILLGSLFAFYYHARVDAAEADQLDDFTSWPPSVQTIRQQVGNKVAQGSTPAARVAAYSTCGDLLTKRFRNHDPKIAVRVKFVHDRATNRDIIHLMCPARMEPWEMDWLAVNTWREIKEDFGRGYDMDIFITYIGLSQIKVAELRPLPGNSDKIEIRYQSPDQIHHAMTGDIAASHAPPASH